MEKKGKKVIGIIIGFAGIALMFGAIYCLYLWNRPHQIPPIVEKIIPALDNQGRKPLYIGFAPSHPLPVKPWECLVDYLKKELGRPVESVYRASYREIRTMLINGELDACITTSFVYILTSQETKIFPLARTIECESSYYRSLIVVKEGSRITNLEGLKGKRFAFTDKESTTGWVLPMAMMIRKGILDPNSYFSEVIFTTDHESALYAVSNGRVEGAAITSTLLCLKDPRIKDKLRDLKIIWESEAVPLGPFSVRAELDNELKEKIKNALLKIGRTADTRSLFECLNQETDIEGFEEAKDMDYDIVRKAYEVIRKPRNE